MKEFFNMLVTEWWGILILCFFAVGVWIVLSAVFYRQFFKRFYDIVLSGLALVVLSPVLLILTVLGALKMKGNPFFTQLRPGKNEKIFKYFALRFLVVGYYSADVVLGDGDWLCL